MRILCSISGLEFTCEHFPGQFYHRETFHPIFHLPQKKLLGYLGKWAAQELTETDSYLLFLALLRSSDLVDFRTHVYRTTSTSAMVANYMEPLAKILIKMNTVIDTSVAFPRYVVSPDTRTLELISGWIETWNEAYKDFLDGYKSAHESRKLITRESALERLIKNPHKDITSYASKIADWASVAGKFPTSNTTSPFTNLPIPLSEYWKVLIVKCARAEGIYSISRADLEELLEHCEIEIPLGTIYSNALFKILRGALEKQKNFLGLGDLDLTKVTYTILSEDSSAEAANMKLVIDAAPSAEPRKEDYPTKLAFIKAKLRWDMSQELQKGAAG